MKELFEAMFNGGTASMELGRFQWTSSPLAGAERQHVISEMTIEFVRAAPLDATMDAFGLFADAARRAAEKAKLQQFTAGQLGEPFGVWQPTGSND